MKTSELTGAALDWMVWELAGGPAAYPKMVGAAFLRAWRGNSAKYLHPSTDWAQGGPIIEREHIGICYYHEADGWEIPNWAAWRTDIDDRVQIMGKTALIAAMRCYVASKLGDEVDVPEEL